jgi:hypothetical protein
VVLESAPADDAAGDAEEGFMDVVADFPADAEAAKPLQERDGLLDCPSAGSESGAVVFAAAGDVRVMFLSRNSLRCLSES